MGSLATLGVLQVARVPMLMRWAGARLPAHRRPWALALLNMTDFIVERWCCLCLTNGPEESRRRGR